MVNLRPFEVTEATRGQHYEKKFQDKQNMFWHSVQCVLALDGIMVNGIMFFSPDYPIKYAAGIYSKAQIRASLRKRTLVLWANNSSSICQYPAEDWL